MDEEGEFGDAIGRVGLFGVARPERALLEGDGRVLRIGADRADDHGLFDTGVSCRFDDVRAEQEIFEIEVGWRGHIGADAAHAGR